MTNQENYPRIVRKNFFKVDAASAFCELPKAVSQHGARHSERDQIFLPELDAIVGNPPYVRQELIPKAQRGVVRDQTKEHLLEVVDQAWPGINLSRQSDLHVYFWPAAARFLKEGGWFGFLASSSWLDVRYGFPLQRWILLNFQIVAILESVHEPWFEDARVKTAVAILKRCSDAAKRDNNLVRFVRIKRPLAEILGERADESQRQEAAERFRNRVLKSKYDFSNDQLRVMLKSQGDLWKDGVSVAEMFARQRSLSAAVLEASVASEDDAAEDATDSEAPEQKEIETAIQLDYGGGKWGRYLRAPDFYFEIMREFGHRFVRLGDIATIKFGIKSGCDAFFMPRDVSKRMLDEYSNEPAWRSLTLIPHCKRSEVQSGRVAIIECGDKTLHPIEREFIRPEIHNLMNVNRAIITADELDRVVLWVSQELSAIKGTYAWHYINWGAKQTFSSRKSKSVPVPERDTCRGRTLWYDLTGLEPGVGFWPKSQQYRHIVPANPTRLNCNCNLYDIHSIDEHPLTAALLVPALNSSLVAFFKPFYGRYAGTEGNLKTEIIDVLLVEIPDPRSADKRTASRIKAAFSAMQTRDMTDFLEDALRDCHTTEEVLAADKLPLGIPSELRQNDRRELDDAVFEMLGVADAKRRGELINRLYEEITKHMRAIRVMEVQKMEQRRRGARSGEVSQVDLAADAWNELEPEWQQPLRDWLADHSNGCKTISLPEGRVRLPAAEHFFEATTLYFGSNPAVSYICANREEADLLHAIAETGLRGSVSVPQDEAGCAALTRRLQEWLAAARERFDDLAAQRAGTDRMRDQVAQLLFQWFIQGRADASAPTIPQSQEVTI